jgi:xylulokinase
MGDKYILSHDMGTSANKAILVSIQGEIIDQTKLEYPIQHPQPGHAEQDPMDWWNAVCSTTRTVLKKSGVKAKNVAGITFSSQTQCLVTLDRQGVPLRPAISWLDGRSADIMRERLWTPPRFQGYNIFRLIRFLSVTGGSPGHTGKDQIGKLLWIRHYQPDIFKKAAKFIDAKDFILYRLTGQYVTSVDLAYIWWMMDTRKKRNRWHPGLCRLAGIEPDQLAEIRESAAQVGTITPEAAEETGLLPGTPVINGAGDLSAAALGSGALQDGQLHICVGTSGWVAGHMRKRKIDIPHYTGCIGSAYPREYYLAMAHQETAGVCLEWLRDHVLYHKKRLQKESRVTEIYEILDQLAEEAGPGAEGLMFTPWMYGERCPLDDDHVRAGLYNVGLNHSREHIIRAVFEGIAFNTRWALQTMENLYRPVEKLHIIGGGARSDIWCQIFADITNREINRVENPRHAGAKGVALLASMTLGYIPSFHDISKYIRIDRVFQPDPLNRRLYDERFREFKNIYRQNKAWYRRMNRSIG